MPSKLKLSFLILIITCGKWVFKKIYKEYNDLNGQKKQLLKVKDDYSRSIKKIEKELDTQKHQFANFKKETDIKKSQLVDNIKIVEEKIKNIQDELSQNQQAIEILKLNKPLFFLPGRKAYNKRMKKYSTEHNKSYDEFSKLNIERDQLKKELSLVRSKENEYEILIKAPLLQMGGDYSLIYYV